MPKELWDNMKAGIRGMRLYTHRYHVTHTDTTSPIFVNIHVEELKHICRPLYTHRHNFTHFCQYTH